MRLRPALLQLGDLSDSESSQGRSGSGQLRHDWAEKGEVIPIVRPLHQRPWLRILLFSLLCVAGVAGAVAIGLFNRWHDARLAEIARQRHCLQAFLHSPEFTAYVRAMDEQMVATINYIAARPLETHPLLPAIAAHDQANRLIPWTQQVVPVPITTAADPAGVVRAVRNVHALLAQRGQVFDDAVRKAARQMFLRTLVPFAQRFVQREPGNVFHAIFLDRSMQEESLAVFARHHGPTASVADSERLFSLYAAVGPSLWKAIEQERARSGPFAAPLR